ncbi:MAG: hypothetical protein GX444_11475 [Myxococcales bacterium]|nr:hypothetical protein [Myxococcales bacterium]
MKKWKIATLCLLLCLSFIASGTSKESKPSRDDGWLVICGQADKDADNEARLKKIDRLMKNQGRLIDTDDWEYLTPHLKVVAAGPYPEKEDALQATAKLEKNGLQCYAKHAVKKSLLKRGITLFGDRNSLWFCLAVGGDSTLSYETCKKQAQAKGTLIRPYLDQKSLGFETVQIDQASADICEPSGMELWSIRGQVVKTEKTAELIKDAKQLKKFASLLRAHVKQAKKIDFENIRVERLTQTDLDGDGKKEWLVQARQGKPENALDDHPEKVLMFLGVFTTDDENARVASVILNAVGEKSAEFRDYYLRSGYDELAGLGDIDGDGRVELLLKTGYYEGMGYEIARYRRGEIIQLGGNGCGA